MAYRIGFGYEQQWPGIYIYDDEDGKVIASEDVMPNEDFMHLWNDSSLDPRPAHSLNLLMSIGEDLDKLAPVERAEGETDASLRARVLAVHPLKSTLKVTSVSIVDHPVDLNCVTEDGLYLALDGEVEHA